jgi:hypothetical protein
MLPHFKNSQAAVLFTEPIYGNLYEMYFVYNDDTKFDKDDLLFIQENTTRYDLRKGKITITLNMLEECSITKFCAIFDDIKHIIICVHNPKGEIKRKITLDSPKNSLEDFSFKQDWNEHNNLVSFDVIIKYTEITSEIIA